MAWGGQGLPKVLPRLAMPFLSTPCSRAFREMALMAVSGVVRLQGPGGRPVAIFFPLGHPMPSAYER
jgi:hypothetical protein